MTIPLLQQTIPQDNAAGVAVTTNLGLGFSEAIKAGSGFIRIYKSDGTLFHSIAITDTSQVTFSPAQPARVQINPNVDLVAGTGYYVLIDAGAIENLAGDDFGGIASTTQFNFTTAGSAPGGDTTAPLLTGTTPLDNATGVAASANLILNFNEAVKAGSGNIEIHNVSDGSIAKTIAITDGSQVTFSGTQLTINPTTDLAAGTSYYVTLASGVVRDLANNNFTGISSSTAFNFTTAAAGDTTAPLLTLTSPADNAINVNPAANLVLTFNEVVKAGSGNIEFRSALDGSLERSIAITDATQVTFSGNQLTINPTTDLAEGVNYYVTFGSGVIRDLANNDFAGVSSPTAFNFSTPLLDLIGTPDDDTLNGGNRNELINGLTGVDALIGGLGDDTYIIANQEGGENSLYIEREPGGGDPGEIWSYILAPGDVSAGLFDFAVDGFVDYIHFYYNGWVLDFSTTQLGTNLTPGTYEDAEYANNPSPGHAGIAVSGPGVGSIGAFGTFTIIDAVFDYSAPTPVLVSFSVSFEQHSDSLGAQALTGTLNYSYAPAGPPEIDSIIENGNEGIDTVQAAVSYTLGPNLENLTLTGYEEDLDGTGNELDNVITGNHGNNILDGGVGADTMVGSYGTDTYVVDNLGDTVIEVFDTASLNADIIQSSVTFALGPYIEHLTLTGSANISGTGNELDNHITGNTGNNVLSGGLGNDLIVGGGGNDTLNILAGGGNDSIVDFSAGAGIGDVVVLDGFALGTFSAVQAAMSQNGANSVLNLGSGHTLTFLNLLPGAFDANDFLFLNVQLPGPDPFTLPVSGAFANTINGTRRADSLAGTGANNKLDGKQGADTMTGLAGDDTYLVDTSGDNVVESTNNGIDTVISSASSYTLANNVENLTLTGTTNHTATGNGLNNLIIASNRPDTINGGAGNDIIIAGTGACVLTGGAGNDIFAFPMAGSQKQITDFHAGEDLVDLRPLLGWYGGSDPVADNVVALSTVAGGVLLSVKATAVGSLQGLIKLTGVSLGDLDVGADILWDA